jgi:hypothetical protein
MFVKPGTRNLALQAIYLQGKGAGLTAISGITLHPKKYTTTASSATGNTALTGTPARSGVPGGEVLRRLHGTVSTALANQGTGGPTDLGLQVGCGAAGPGGWVAPNPDSTHVARRQRDDELRLLQRVLGTASMKYEITVETQE